MTYLMEKAKGMSHWVHGRIVMNQWSLRTTGVDECLSSSGWPSGKKKINVKMIV